MNEKTVVEILADYLVKKGYEIETHTSSRRFFLAPGERFLNTKYIIFKSDSLFFCAYDTFATKAFTSKTFTGIYSIMELDNKLELKINKKDWLDFLFRRNKIQTDIDFLDENFTITSKLDLVFRNWFNTEEALYFLKIFEKITPIELIIQNDYLPLIDEFKGKKIIGLETNQWLYKNDELDLFLDLGIKLINSMRNINASHTVYPLC